MSTGGFSNPVAAGGGALVRASMHSPNWVSGTSGWTINQDGTAEFNTLGGTVQFNSLGIFFYIPIAGSGNLRFSITMADGMDPYGNLYKAGLFVNQEQIWATGDNSHTVIVNASGASGPQVLFTVAGHTSLAEIIGDQAGSNNRLLIQATAGSGARLDVNMPFVATGGYQGMNTGMGAQPAFNVPATFTEFPSADWFPLTILCPPSETIIINTMMIGRNTTTANSTIDCGPKVKQGATTLLNPTNTGNSVHLQSADSGGLGATNNAQGFNQYVVGTDILGGRAGQTLTIIPCWRYSSGGPGPTASLTMGQGSMSAYPSPYVQPQSG